MKTTGIANLKAHLSEILAEVKGGEEILVTDRGNPVARLTSVEPAVGGTESLRDLERTGVVRLPRKPPDPSFLDQSRPRDPEGRSLEVLLQEREEGW